MSAMQERTADRKTIILRAQPQSVLRFKSWMGYCYHMLALTADDWDGVQVRNANNGLLLYVASRESVRGYKP